MQEMAGVMHREFHELELDGTNYLSWAMDTKIALECRKLGPTVTTPAEGDAEIPQAAKYTSLSFIRHHLHPDLKIEYLMEEDPLAL